MNAQRAIRALEDAIRAIRNGDSTTAMEAIEDAIREINR